MRISDWSSDVCSSDLLPQLCRQEEARGEDRGNDARPGVAARPLGARNDRADRGPSRAWRQSRRARPRPFHQAVGARSEEHTSELQSLMRISYAVFCSTKKKQRTYYPYTTSSTTLLHT